ncbi:MAG: ATP-binding cassette domain-containing protein [Planctomycetota bacterium]
MMQQLSHLRVKAASIERPPGELSGGNQQKLLLARLLLCEASVLIVDEPTRGIDIGAKHEIHELLRSLCARGSAILLISSELPEVIALSDRVLVMREGRMAGELERSRVSAERVMELATG